jgi:hypothetical protein
VAYIRDFLMDKGLAPEPLFLACGIEPLLCDENDRPLPATQVANLLEQAASYSGDSCLGLHMAQRYHYESASLLILAVLAAPSVAEGIRCLCHYDRYVDTAIETSFDFGLVRKIRGRFPGPVAPQVHDIRRFQQHDRF